MKNRKITSMFAVAMLAAFLAGCTTTSKDGFAAGIGFDSRGESTNAMDPAVINAVKQIVEDKLGPVQGTANEAKQMATQAASSATKASEDAVAAKSEAGTAAMSANEAKSSAGGAQFSANTAVQHADNASETATKAVNSADKAQVVASANDKALALTNSGLDGLTKKVDDRQKDTDAKISEAKEKAGGVSTTQMATILGGAATAAAAGGVMAKTGKSRSQGQIDDLQKQVTDLHHKVAQTKM